MKRPFNDLPEKRFTEEQMRIAINSYNAQSLSKVKEAIIEMQKEEAELNNAPINANRISPGSTISIEVGSDEDFNDKIRIRKR